MTTDVDIANMALSRLGTRATIADLAENSTEARVVAIHYTTVRDGLVREARPAFALITADLSLSGTAPDRWTYSYAMPSGSLRFLKLDDGFPAYDIPTPPRLPYEIASDGSNSFILCDVSGAVAIYIQRVTDPGRMDALFIAAFADALAAAIALPITQKLEIASKMEARAARSFALAASGVANEGSVTSWADFDPDSVRAR